MTKSSQLPAVCPVVLSQPRLQSGSAVEEEGGFRSVCYCNRDRKIIFSIQNEQRARRRKGGKNQSLWEAFTGGKIKVKGEFGSGLEEGAGDK